MSGRIRRQIDRDNIQNESNGFLVGVLDCEEEQVTVVGCLPH